MLDVNNLLGWSGKTPQTSQVWVLGGNGHGVVRTVNRRFTRVASNTGASITYTDDPNNGGLFTINRAGIYAIVYNDSRTAGGATIGITVNNVAPTTAISSLAYPVARSFLQIPTATSGSTVCIDYFNRGDIIAANDSGQCVTTGELDVAFRIVARVLDQ